MNYGLVRYMVGNVLMFESLLMLLPFGVSIAYDGPDKYIFLLVGAVTALAGKLFSYRRPTNQNFQPRDGFFAVALSWVALAFFGAMPFYLCGYFNHFVDCFFEAVSGFTTTGASILTAIEPLPKGILFWRSLMHWIGGMGILVFVLAFLPTLNGSSIQLLRAESPGPTPGKMVPKLKETARILYIIYFSLTVTLVVLLVASGLPLYDSLIHAMGSAGTGGFSNMNLSVGAYQNVRAEVIITIFCFLFGANFNLYYFLLKRQFKLVWKNEELRLYFGIVIGSILLITANVYAFYGNSITESLRHASFQVVTIITTTGFSTTDFNLWPTFSKTILMCLMIIGACGGSTGGGIKVTRLLTLFKAIRQEVGKIIYPRRVTQLRVDGGMVNDGTIKNILLFFAAYILMLFGATLLLSLDGFDFITNFTATISALGNIGPGLEIVGPMGNFQMFSKLSKLVLSFCMLAGRLEIFPMLILFSPSMWRKNTL